jgi:hypothetical protein
LAEADALAVDAQARGPVDHLVAQLAPVVVGQRQMASPVCRCGSSSAETQLIRSSAVHERDGKPAACSVARCPVAQQQQLLQAREFSGLPGSETLTTSR